MTKQIISKLGKWYEEKEYDGQGTGLVVWHILMMLVILRLSLLSSGDNGGDKSNKDDENRRRPGYQTLMKSNVGTWRVKGFRIGSALRLLYSFK